MSIERRQESGSIPFPEALGVLRAAAEETRLRILALLAEGEDGRSAALIVDTILGQRQVVIKSLEANYRRVDGIAAATILGDGRVALILDVDALICAQHDDTTNFDMLLQATG